MVHHPTLNVEKDTVTMILYTHDINDVSERDLELSKYADDVYDDVKFIESF
jgi:pterin-4a-carbinolamine dehydratase